MVTGIAELIVLAALGIPLLVMAIPLVAVLGHFLVEALRALRAGESSGGAAAVRRATAEEVQTIQELQQLARRLDERVEVLETLLLDRSTDKRGKSD